MEHNSNQVRATLVNLLRDEADSASALLQSLKSESAALASRDAELVTIDSDNKRQLIDTLQKASDARIAFMQQNGLASITALEANQVPENSSGSELNTLTVQLSDLAHRCFEENRIIGQLINRRTQFITQILSSLSRPAGFQDLTYEENGSTSSDKHSSVLHLTEI